MKRILFFNLICLTAIGCWAQQDAPYRIIDTTMVFTKEDFTIHEDWHGLAYIHTRDDSDPSLTYGLAKDANARFPWWMPTFSLNGDEMLVSIDDVSCEFSDEVFFASGLHIANGHVISYLETDAPLKNYYVYSRRYDISDYDEEMLKTVHDFQVIASPFRYDSETQTLYLRTKVHIQIRLSYRPKNRYIDEGVVQDQDGNPIPNALVTLLDTITCRTDAEGRYRAVFESRIENLSGSFRVEAENHTSYRAGVSAYFSDWLEEVRRSRTIKLYNALDLKAGQMHSFVFPVTPDASLGRFFRLKGHKGKQIIFERDFKPKAFVPYILIPTADVRLDLSELKLKDDTLMIDREDYGVVHFEGAFFSLSGGYVRTETNYQIDEDFDGSPGWIEAMHATLLYPRDMNPVELVLLDPEGVHRSFIEEGKVWTVGEYLNGESQPVHYRDYYFDGDTVVAGQTCKRWMERVWKDDASQGTIAELGALYEEDGKVWLIAPQSATPQLLYDFSAAVGDELVVNGTKGVDVVDVRWVALHGRKFHCISLRNKGTRPARLESMKNVWIDGIGNLQSPLDNYCEQSVSVSHRLLSCSVGDEVLYDSDDNPLARLADERDDDCYRPLIEEGKQWVVGVLVDGQYEYRKTYRIGPPNEMNYYYVYNELYCDIQQKDRPFAFRRFVGWVRESKHQIWLRQFDQRDPVLIYDFSMRSGDTITVEGFSDLYSLGQKLTAAVDYTGAAVYGPRSDLPLKTYQLPSPLLSGGGTEWIAGVGSPASPACNFYISEREPAEQLISCSVGSDTLYYDSSLAARLDAEIPALPGPAYRPFLEEGKVWKVGLWRGGEAKQLEYYYLGGDTIVGGMTGKRMYCQHVTRADEPFADGSTEPWTEYVGALREEGRRVYLAKPDEEEFLLIYDFTPEEGDTLTVGVAEARDDARFVSAYVKSYFPNTNNHFKGYCLYLMTGAAATAAELEALDPESYPYHNYALWMDGIGAFAGPLYNVLSQSKYLMTCTVGDEVLYFNDNIKDGVTPPDDQVKKQRLDFTHVVKPVPKSPSRSRVEEAAAGDAAEPLTGEYSAETLFVDMRDLVGPYTVTLRGDDGTEFYRKEVETSYTLGLSTALARYGQSSLTLTIENAAEQYVATLLLDDENGIVDINEDGRPTPDTEIVNGKSVNGQWYDLSSRRLAVTSPRSQPVSHSHSSVPSVLPKGVYISSGKKVVVR